MEQEKVQVLAQLNQEMIGKFTSLQNALDIGNAAEVEKIKEEIITIQKKISAYIEQ